MNIEEIAEFYADIDFKDWEHPQSGAPMIKIQHPEYELFTADSTHFNAGVACADYHMAFTRDGAAKFSTHDVKSPLLNAEAACGQCHTSVEYVTNRMATIQNQVFETMSATQDAIIAAITAIEAASAHPGVEPTLLDEARQLHRESQMRWDFIAAENSMGFHNPEEALRILAAATNLARQAELKAVQAAGTTDILQTRGN
jgi:nitrite reductase (cytochrome c-552)